MNERYEIGDTERMHLLLNKKLIMIVVFIITFGLWCSQVSAKTLPTHAFPRKANYYLPHSLSEGAARELAKWDVVILDMETQVNSRQLLKQMRAWNPNIVLLAYITPQEIARNAATGDSAMRRRLAGRLSDTSYLTNSSGNRLSFWPGTYLLNVTMKAPRVDGVRLNQVIPQFVADEILATDLWDGVFFDNAWDSVTWAAGRDIDFDRDGLSDLEPDREWVSGLRFIFDETRRLTGDKYLIVANSDHRVHRDWLNGTMIESFENLAWNDAMKTYAYNERSSVRPLLNIVNNNAGNTPGQADYRNMRYGLTSALLENGYYAYDYGDQDHGQTWWYDEYDAHLGTPLGSAVSEAGRTSYDSDVWQRRFSNGVVLVNSTGQARKVTLSNEYEKIRGIQDRQVNDGSIVSETVLGPKDGVILLNQLAKLDDVLFSNGAFARFFRPGGERVRNGFFVFDEAYKGGDQVAHIDVDGDGFRDVLLIGQNRITAWRVDGQQLMRLYPYGADYKGELHVSLGDADGNGEFEIYVAPGEGKAQPVKVYSVSGTALRAPWFPLGDKYTGGLTLALGNTRGTGTELIVGSGKGIIPKVSVYQISSEFNFTRVAEWSAFEAVFKGGVRVAAGDVDGNGIDEVIVGAGKGKKPIVRVFNGSGKKLYTEFVAYTTFELPGIDVAALDVNNDGKEDIVAFSKGIGF